MSPRGEIASPCRKMIALREACQANFSPCWDGTTACDQPGAEQKRRPARRNPSLQILRARAATAVHVLRIAKHGGAMRLREERVDFPPSAVERERMRAGFGRNRFLS